MKGKDQRKKVDEKDKEDEHVIYLEALVYMMCCFFFLAYLMYLIHSSNICGFYCRQKMVNKRKVSEES